ncbi:MAG: fibrobacter succinogenes major paralogous domain-containing protein [Bacteroides sp.]|nr:fibrobacter succinogenes major paralogous domain-containing protein [Bacteroides sp.]
MRVSNRGINYFYTTNENVVFEQGYTTTFNIEITQQGIIVTSDVVGEWNDGGTITGGIGERPPRILDLNGINWEESYVHYIYDGNTLIGQVCREYLFRNITPRVDLPAIVVYPLGTDGRMDLTKGFVPRVYNRDRNSANQYEFNTGNVHGGNVIFGPRDTLYTYYAGTLPLVNKVRIETTHQITAEPDNAIPILTTLPYTLTDIDNNVYAVTKIGTQYWIRENYKAEHYANGDPLEHYYYNDDAATYKDMIGAYYTWYAIVNTAGIAPEGWRVPTRDDWNSLYHYVNPETGRKIKALYMWSNTVADDVTGFSGLPGGRRSPSGNSEQLNSYGQWWASTESSAANGWRIYVGTGTAITESNHSKAYAESVRLMRDN